MKLRAVQTSPLKAVCLSLWFLVVLLPLLALVGGAASAPVSADVMRPVWAALARSFVLAGVIATAAVVLGWLPGRLLGTSRAHTAVLLLLLLMPLALPRYVLYYAWTLLLSPTTQLGRMLAAKPGVARLVGTMTSTGVLIGWCWPLAALVLGQGWRSVDRRIWESASLDASRFQRFRHVTLPLLGRSALLAFGVCFVLSLSEFATFHLAGVETVGTELAVLYELTGAMAPVARAAWPVAVVAVGAALAMSIVSRQWRAADVPLTPAHSGSGGAGWGVLAALLAVSVAAPVALLLFNVTSLQAFRQFMTLHADDVGWSLLTASLAAGVAFLIALGALFCRPQRESRGALARRWIRRVMSLVVSGTIFLAMFLPASLLAVSLLKLVSGSGLPAAVRQSWLIVSAGQAVRFAGLALVLLLLTRYPDRRRLAEMAALDGASPIRTWWHIDLPRTWPVLAGTYLLVMMFSFSELSATMVLLPAGLPNFAQRLLNQMHYARDQQVIASCLVLVGLFFVLVGLAVALLQMRRVRPPVALVLLLAIVLGMVGCGRHGGQDGEPHVVGAFGKTGAGRGEFLYPRAIDITADGTLVVLDKTGRIQRLTDQGHCLGLAHMPLTEAGKPTGISVHRDGRLFVADTHYHRVAILSPEGELIGEFGKFGRDDGCFIYPTDVAFSGDGRIFVSEYGDNDRISVFTAEGEFLFCFGSPGAGQGQLSRPAALCIDETRGRLYVADACNHRIAIYTLDGRVTGYIGSLGRDAGQLRYPYDLALLADGTIVVCEYGNNRIQLFGPTGESLATYGRAGRQLGQLAYPWGVVVDARRRAYVVDAGNNRIQVWQL